MFTLLLIFAAQGSENVLSGYWSNQTGSVTVLIAPCVQDGWCGTVQWASDKAKADAARHGTPTLVGTELLHGFIAVAPDRWKGRLFIPDMNRTSKAELRLVDPDRVRIRGCAVGGMVCKSQTWTRIVAR